MYLRFNIQFTIYCSFSPKTKNVSLALCQSTEHFQYILLTKLLGQFIELHNTHIFKRLENLT